MLMAYGRVSGGPSGGYTLVGGNRENRSDQ
jgi:hypothetical protein